jgi:hypothetical protein
MDFDVALWSKSFDSLKFECKQTMIMVIGDIHVALAEYIRYGVWEFCSIIGVCLGAALLLGLLIPAYS